MRSNFSSTNNFSLIRLIAAFFVIHYHAYVLTKNNSLFLGSDLGVFGVSIFFFTSGFLITQSWLSKPCLKVFIVKRLLRIMPALLICILFTIFIIGPMNTSLSLTEYLFNKATFLYFKNILLYPLQFSLPGVFLSNLYPITVNGSLWTLPLEFTLYCILAIFGAIQILKKRCLLLFLVLFLIAIEQFILKDQDYQKITIYYMYLNLVVRYSTFFLLGSLAFLYRNNIKINHKLALALIIIFIIINNLSFNILYYYVFISYFVLFVAFGITHRISYLRRFGDPSYGVYIYAFPIQQTLINLYADVQPLQLSLLSSLIALIIGLISWHVIESPVLKLKKYLH